MRRKAGFDEAASALRARSTLLSLGWSERDVARAVVDGRLHRVRRGWYVDGGWWRSVWDESRHLALVAAVARDAAFPPVFSHASAAMLWELPWWGRLPARAHVLMGTADRSSRPDVFRHEGVLSDDDVALRHGLRCTTLARTLIDVARTASPESALSAADAALQIVAGAPREHSRSRAEAWREELRGRLHVRGARGVRVARRIIDLADGRAELPGESVSRLQLVRAGFTRLDLQVEVAAPAGRYWVDFGLEDARAWGEFDGKGKYLDEAARSGLSLDAVMLREKQREDWIRGTTQRRFARWGSEHIGTPDALAARLAAFGIHPVR